MHVEQRHVTTVNLQDGLARDFVIVRDPRGCKVTCAARDEILNLLLSYQDFQRLCQTVAQPDGADVPGATAEAVPPAEPPVEAAGASICVEHRRVTTVALHPSRAREFALDHDHRGYRLSSVARDEVVTIFLSADDFRKLRRQVARWEWRDVRRDHSTAITATPPSPAAAACEDTVPVAPAYAWGAIDWLGFNCSSLPLTPGPSPLSTGARGEESGQRVGSSIQSR